MSVEAEAGLPLIPWIKPADTAGMQAGLARPIVDAAIPYDAVWDCATCGACVEACPVLIEHVDKIVGLAPQPGARGEPLPGRADRRLHGHGALRQPVGAAGQRAARLDQGAAVHGATAAPGRGRRSRRGERAGVPLLGRLRRLLRRPQQARRAGLRDLPRRGRGAVRGARPGRVVQRRSGPSDGQRVRLPDAGGDQHRDARPLPAEDHRDGLPALLQHHRQRVLAAGRPTTRWCTTRPTCHGWWGRAGSAPRPPMARRASPSAP